MTVTSPTNDTTTYTFDIASKRVKSIKDALNHTTSWTYDSVGRVLTATAPEGNLVEYVYDARGNVTTTRVHAKPSTGQPDIVTTATYSPTCSNAVTCNQPTDVTDALGHITQYTYDPTHGGVTSVKLPAPSTSAVQPEVRTSYTGYTDYFGGTVYRATSTSTCRTTASCTNTADETVSTVNYGTLAGNNLQPIGTTTRAGDNSVSASASVSYDAAGNIVTATDPMNAVSTFQYNADRARTMTVGPDPDGAGPLSNRTTRTNYNADGTVASVEVGTATSSFGSFTSLQQANTTYDSAGRKLTESVTAGGTTYALTQYGYDPANRAACVAVRMNPAAYGSLPASGCSLGTAGTSGPDRITRTVADQAGRTVSEQEGYGTGDVAYSARASYTANGKVATATDANGNVTSYGYDAYDRGTTVTYPGGSYEQLTINAGGQVTNRRLRDNNNIAFGYDALGRLTSQTRPAIGYNTTLSYGYDNVGQVTSATGNWSGTNSYGYDALGRMTSETNPWLGTTSWQYDAGGQRTRLTWADGLYVTYDRDSTGAVTAIRENGGRTGARRWSATPMTMPGGGRA